MPTKDDTKKFTQWKDRYRSIVTTVNVGLSLLILQCCFTNTNIYTCPTVVTFKRRQAITEPKICEIQ